MWACWVLIVGLGILFLVSGNEQIAEKQQIKWYRIPFYKAALFLAGAGKKEKIKDEAWEKNCAKIETALLILFAGMAGMILLESTVSKSARVIENNRLERPEKGQGEQSYSLYANVENLEDGEPILLNLEERQYTEKEKETILKQAEEEADRILLGENESRDEVRGKVCLPASLQDGNVSVQWICNPEGLLDEDGMIIEGLPENGEILTVTAIMSCDGKEISYESALHLMPQIRSEEEQLRYDLRYAVKEAKDHSVQSDQIILPEEVDGREIIWSEEQTSVTGACFIGVLFMAVLGYFGKEAELRREEKEKRQQILLDYPDILFKMGMLLGAGLTIQNAFTKIASEYQEMQKVKGTETRRYAYEEMTASCNEMKSGISEAKAYEDFGRRCKEPCYIRLGTILSGGLQKSSEGLTQLLLNEAQTAMEDRRQLARKMGEEAGTKLLFPMILMLMVVLVILMVPAMMSF